MRAHIAVRASCALFDKSIVAAAMTAIIVATAFVVKLFQKKLLPARLRGSAGRDLPGFGQSHGHATRAAVSLLVRAKYVDNLLRRLPVAFELAADLFRRPAFVLRYPHKRNVEHALQSQHGR